MSKKLIFDIESDGLFGKGFAYAYVKLDENNNIIELDSCMSQIEVKDEWVRQNVLPMRTLKNVHTNKALRNSFFEVLKKSKDCQIWGDVVFPVETNFLEEVANDDIESRKFEMPYPLFDISTIRDINIPRIKTFNEDMYKLYPQLINSLSVYNLKEHNPLHDVLASTYLLTHNKNIINYYIDNLINL
jgi:hypothetical protein